MIGGGSLFIGLGGGEGGGGLCRGEDRGENRGQERGTIIQKKGKVNDS